MHELRSEQEFIGRGQYAAKQSRNLAAVPGINIGIAGFKNFGHGHDSLHELVKQTHPRDFHHEVRIFIWTKLSASLKVPRRCGAQWGTINGLPRFRDGATPVALQSRNWCSALVRTMGMIVGSFMVGNRPRRRKSGGGFRW